MSVSKYVSQVKAVHQNNQIIYNYLSDFRNLGQFINDFTLEQISSQIPNGEITDFSTEIDSCEFNISSFGKAGCRIVERTDPKTIKFTVEGNIPLDFTFWIQILPVSAYESKIRLTLHANLNMMMKMMLNKKLQEGIDRMADTLASFPYAQANSANLSDN